MGFQMVQLLDTDFLPISTEIYTLENFQDGTHKMVDWKMIFLFNWVIF